MSIESVSGNSSTTWVESFDNNYSIKTPCTLQKIIVLTLSFFTFGIFYVFGRALCACLDSFEENEKAQQVLNRQLNVIVENTRQNSRRLSEQLQSSRERSSRRTTGAKELLDSLEIVEERCNCAKNKLNELENLYQNGHSSSLENKMQELNAEIDLICSSFTELFSKNGECKQRYDVELSNVENYKPSIEKLETVKFTEDELTNYFEDKENELFFTMCKAILDSVGIMIGFEKTFLNNIVALG